MLSRTYAPPKTSTGELRSPMLTSFTVIGPMMTVSAMSTNSPPIARVAITRSRLGQMMSEITMSMASRAVPTTGSSASMVFWSKVITWRCSRQHCEVHGRNLRQDVVQWHLP